MFTGDTGGTSTCAAADPACLQLWPPFTSKGAPVARKGIKASLLGTTETSGRAQVTYNRHPLYYFRGGAGFGAGDKKPGDVEGQGVLSVWYVLSPAGRPIRK